MTPSVLSDLHASGEKTEAVVEDSAREKLRAAFTSIETSATAGLCCFAHESARTQLKAIRDNARFFIEKFCEWDSAPTVLVTYHRDDEGEKAAEAYAAMMVCLDNDGRKKLANLVAHGAKATLGPTGIALTRSDWKAIEVLPIALNSQAEREASSS